MWIKKQTLEIDRKTQFEFYSMSDPALNADSEKKEYTDGNYSANLIWDGEKTCFICKPLSISEWNEIQLKVYAKAYAIADETEKNFFIVQFLALEAFKTAFRKTVCGKTEHQRKEIFDSIPVEVQVEIGQHIIVASTKQDFF